MTDAGPTIAATVAAMGEGRQSSVALIEAAAAAAREHAALNALAEVDWTRAREQARRFDVAARAGESLGPLHGIPISIKDLFRVEGFTMHAGTRAQLPGLTATEAEAVARLRAAGALLFATTNLHEVALGATGENIWTGDVCNPHDPARQAGGSSSGAGVCVATGIGLAALGSDTGGSVRIPANFCGVVGFKPSFGAIPLGGALHLSWSCDHAGPLTRSVADAALLYEVMSGRSAAHAGPARRSRLAIPRSWLAARLEDAVRERFEQTVATLRAHGAEIIDVDPAALDLAWYCYSPLVRAEGAYVHRQALAAGGEGFSEAVRQPLQIGRELLAHDYLDAQRAADEVRTELRDLLRGVDALILPTASVLPPLRGQTEVRVPGGVKPVRELVLGQTLPFNLAGVPAITVPMGRSQGLPVGLQMVGAWNEDASLLALAGWAEPIVRGD